MYMPFVMMDFSEVPYSAMQIQVLRIGDAWDGFLKLNQGSMLKVHNANESVVKCLKEISLGSNLKDKKAPGNICLEDGFSRYEL